MNTANKTKIAELSKVDPIVNASLALQHQGVSYTACLEIAVISLSANSDELRGMIKHIMLNNSVRNEVVKIK